MGLDVINRIDDTQASVNQVKQALANGTLHNLPEIDLVGVGGPAAQDEDDLFV